MPFSARRVRTMIRKSPLEYDLRGQTVILDGRHTMMSNMPFCHALVRHLLILRRADHVKLVATNSEFSTMLRHAAEDAGVRHMVSASLAEDGASH